MSVLVRAIDIERIKVRLRIMAALPVQKGSDRSKTMPRYVLGHE